MSHRTSSYRCYLCASSAYSKHFNVGSTSFLGWYDVATSHNVNQRWSNVVYVNVEIYNVEQLNWITLDNVETTLSFSTSIFATLGIWPFEKKYKPRFKNKIIFLNFKEYVGLNIFLHFFPILTLSWRRPLSYRNQSIDLLGKSMDWFLYDNGLRHERVKRNLKKNICKASKNLKRSNILNNKKYI